MSETVPLTKDEQGKLWGELKQRWAILKNQSSPEGDKTSAKKRINEIQQTLKLDTTDFTKPYTPKTQTQTTTVNATLSPQTTIESSQKPNTFRDVMSEFMNTALPIAIENARKYAPEEDTKGQLIVAEAFLKPLGMVYSSLIRNIGK